MLRVIGFDLDGTLAETFPVIFDSFRETVKQFTGKTIDDQVILATFGVNELGMLKQLLPDVDLKTASTAFYQAYRKAHEQLRTPFPGIVDLIRELQERGIETPLVTGKGREACQISLEMLGLTDLFATVLTGSPERNIKTDNFNDLLANRNLQTNELAYIGDTVGDIQSAEGAGIHCFSAAWSKFAKLDELASVHADSYRTVTELRQRLLP